MKLKKGEFLIETDEHNYVLKEKLLYKEGKNVGQEYYSAIGYFPSLESISKKLLSLGLNTVDEVKSIEEAINIACKRILTKLGEFK